MAVPNPAAGQFLKVRATASIGGQTAVWGSDFRISSIGGAGLTLEDMADFVGTIFDGELPPTLANTVAVGRPILELIAPLTGVVLQSFLGVSSFPVGTGGATCAPKQVAAIVQKVSGLAGPSNRGRMYWPFLSTTFLNTDGTISGAGRTAITTAAINCFFTLTPTVGADSVNLEPVITTRQPVGVPVEYIEIIGLVTSTKLGTQKKRGDYGKPNPPI